MHPMDEHDAAAAAIARLEMNPMSPLLDAAAALKAWRDVELKGNDVASPVWWDAIRRLRDAADRLDFTVYDVDLTPSGEHGADSLTGGV